MSRFLAVGAALVVAAITSVTWVGDERSQTPSAQAPSPPHAALASAGPAYADLAELTAASDVVVIGRAVSVGPGRVFPPDPAAGQLGSPSSGLVSGIVVLQVGAVLSGADPGATILLEEEESTTAGAPVVVDGLRATTAGDQGIFFLVAGGDPTVPYYATTSTAGRFLRVSTAADNDHLLGVTTDPLATRLAALGGRALTDAVLALTAQQGTR